MSDGEGATPAGKRRSYPISLALAGRRVVVVGGGPVAQRKVAGLLAAGAAVTVVAKEATAELRRLAAAGRVMLLKRSFEPQDLSASTLVFAATRDRDTNAAVRAAARAHGALVSDAADGALGDFTVPAVHRAGSVQVAVDTGGLAPAFAQRVRDDVAALIDERYARALSSLRGVRRDVLNSVAPEGRASIMQSLAKADLQELTTMSPAAALARIEATAVRPLVCATRGSPLATRQARQVMDQLAERGVPSTMLILSTAADRSPERPLRALAGDGFFVKELELALREHRADYAVHSCKDLPSALPDDMRLAAIGLRDDARDAFCSERFSSLAALPAGAVVGTSSPRRVAQLRALRDDLRYEPIRGNVETRLRKMREGHYDAVVLAMAGLLRLGIRATHTVPFEAEHIVPAAGQGALAAECRSADQELAQRLHAAHADPQAELCVSAERALLRALRAGCQAPVGAFATAAKGGLALVGCVAAEDGSRLIRRRSSVKATTVTEAEQAGAALAGELQADGAEALLKASRR